MKHLIYILLAFLVSSCCTYQRCMDKYPPAETHVVTTQHDTIERLRDTVITNPADSAWFKSYLRCDSLGNVYLSELIGMRAGNRLRQAVSIKNNMLTVDTKIDSSAIYFAWAEKTIISTTVDKATKTQPLKPQVRSPTKWEKLKDSLATVWEIIRFIWDVGWLIFLLVWFIYKYLNYKIPFF